MLVKLRDYKARRFGERGLLVTLPKEYTELVGIGAGDDLELFRDTKKPQILIVAPKGVVKSR